MWVNGIANERMSICGMNVTNFGAKIEASGDPGWCLMGIQNHAVKVNARVHQQRYHGSWVVFGSHEKKNLF